MMKRRDMNTQRIQPERGFSLIEVLVSLGLLAGVMVAVSSLFIFGGKEVKSGKEMTEAYSLAHDMQEEMDRMTYTQAWQYFMPTAINPAVDTTYSVLTTTTSGHSTDALATLAGYQANINGKLYQGVGTLEVEALDATGTAVALNGGIAIRVTVRVEWWEGTNQRYLHVRSVRF